MGEFIKTLHSSRNKNSSEETVDSDFWKGAPEIEEKNCSRKLHFRKKSF